MTITLPTSLPAGHEPSADELAGILQVENGFIKNAQVVCSADVTLSGTGALDVTGATVSFQVIGSTAFAIVTGVFDFDMQVASGSGGNLRGLLNVDGAAQTPEAHKNETVVDRVTASQTWLVSLAAGSHTLKLQAARTVSAGTQVVRGSHTTMTVVLYDMP